MKWRGELVDHVKANIVFAMKHPRAFAKELKERGFYSATTYPGDIERSVAHIVQAILRNEMLTTKYTIEYEI